MYVWKIECEIINNAVIQDKKKTYLQILYDKILVRKHNKYN